MKIRDTGRMGGCHRPLGDDEKVRIRELAESGLTTDQIMVVTGRGRTTINRLTTALGIGASVRRGCTDDEIATIRRMAADGSSYDEMAAAVGRPRASIEHVMNRHGIVYIKRRRLGEMQDEIAERYEAGGAIPDIARAMGLSPKTIEYHVRTTGAVNESTRVVAASRHYDDDLRALSMSGFPTAEIARRLGLTISTVRNRLVTLARYDAVVEERAAA
ncbi:hypothetical protein H9Q09_12055 [Aurantimonas sp. DM33-3]|uniref:hypothetical protein n=1 Tax=Aurantimonas TaxID=182269 RepID=UPI00165202E2|nr:MULTISPECIES: hypothetical protein [Aurantimonas]MBC6716942.1 hypothetical protein [Aurantimonas sp. DM33-3]MCC4298412.1 hypothetical protein [Aurantimonas coralicida]